ncbi:hypothetical protein VNI00_018108 [Paramarasmius palmivorus]|uniref:Uncharacterized protein n=1 Tax=Paramarasmius palmivorus TaxID=297713 RepID=A0AAW0B2D6_9AGAR
MSAQENSTSWFCTPGDRLLVVLEELIFLRDEVKQAMQLLDSQSYGRPLAGSPITTSPEHLTLDQSADVDRDAILRTFHTASAIGVSPGITVQCREALRSEVGSLANSNLEFPQDHQSGGVDSLFPRGTWEDNIPMSSQTYRIDLLMGRFRKIKCVDGMIMELRRDVSALRQAIMDPTRRWFLVDGREIYAQHQYMRERDNRMQILLEGLIGRYSNDGPSTVAADLSGHAMDVD